MRALLCSVALVLLFSVASQAYPGREILKYEQKIPCNKINNCERNWANYPNSTDYIFKRVVPAAGTGLFFVVLSLVICFCCICCRLWACCCDCCKKSFCDCCCGTGGIKTLDPPGDDKTKFSIEETMFVPSSGGARCAYFVVLVVCLLGICIGGGVGSLGVDKVVSGSTGLFDAALNSANTMKGVTKVVQKAMTNIGQSPSSSEMDKAIDNIINKVKDIKKSVTDQSDNSQMGSKIFFALFAVNLLLGVCAYCCKTGCLASIMTLPFGFLLLIVAWLLFAVFYGMGAMLDDTCVQLDMWHTCKGGKKAPAGYCDNLRIDAFIPCPDASAFKSGYTTSYSKVVDLITNYKTLPGMNSKAFTYPNATCVAGKGVGCVLPTSMTKWTENTAWRKTQYAAVGGSCNPTGKKSTAYDASCLTGALPTKCPTNTLGGALTDDACIQKAILTSADVLWGASYVASCNFLTSMATDVTAKEGSCNKLTDGFIYLFAGLGLIGALYFIVIAIGIRGGTVWSSDYYQPEDGEGAQMQETGGATSDQSPPPQQTGVGMDTYTRGEDSKNPRASGNGDFV
jgi:hypothetical protein